MKKFPEWANRLPILLPVVVIVCIVGYYAVLFGAGMAELTYKTNVEFPLVKDVAKCAVTSYLEAEGCREDVTQMACGVDKMERYWVEVTFQDDPLTYQYEYDPAGQSVCLTAIHGQSEGAGTPQHSPAYDTIEPGSSLYVYSIEEYLQAHEFSKVEQFVKSKLFERVAVRVSS